MMRATSRCGDVAGRLYEAAEGTPLASGARRHLEPCLRCQVEAARSRRLRRALQALRAEVLVPSPELVADVLATLTADDPDEDGRWARAGRGASVLGVGAGAVTAAGTVALVVRALTERRPPVG